MGATVKKVNSFFKSPTKADVDSLLSQILFSERQEKIFNMFYVKKHDIGFIADTLCVSVSVINSELKLIREKVVKII